MRHAKAEPVGPSDDLRPLAAEGRAAAQRIGRRLQASGVRIDAVYHSGLLRAAETAQLVSAQLEPSPRVRQHAGMRPEDTPASLRAWVQSVTEAGETMLVSHMPFVQALVSYLVLGDDRWAVADFKTGAVARLEPAGQRWVLTWLLTPKLAW
jgi:phosphohistidine phosphatase